MKSLSAKTFQCGVTVQGLTTLSGTVYLTALTNTATWDYVVVGTTAQGQLYTRTYAQLMSDITSGIGLSGYVPTSRTLTINGVSYDLTANRSWTISTVDYTSRLQHQVKAGVAINKGQAVYVTSADGTNMIVGLASNASEATSSKTMGLLDATVSTNGFANVVTEGLLAGLDTSAAGTEGDPVWLGTGGNLIYGLINKPYAPAHLVFIGIVTRKNSNNGEIFVKVQNGFELNEIHDVDLKTNLPVNGELLGFNGTLWVNKTIAGWLGYTPANASGTTNYISKFTGASALGNSQIFDNGTNVGIGTTSPSGKLQIADDGPNALVLGSAQISTIGETNDGGYPGMKIVPYNSNIHIGISSTNDNRINLWHGGSNYAYWQQLSTYTIFSNYSSNALALQIHGGNVGIGTTSPAAKLHTVGTNIVNIVESSTSVSYTQYYNSSTGAGSTSDGLTVGLNGIDAYVFSREAGNLILGTLDTERVRITSTGLVGIGTSSPQARLQVSSSTSDGLIVSTSANAEPFIALWRNSGSNGVGVLRLIDGGNIYFDNGATGAAQSTKMVLTAAGNLGIGTTSPVSKLTVTNGNIEIQSDGSSSMTNYLKIGTHTGGSWGSYISASSFYNSNLNTNLRLGVSNSGTLIDVISITSVGDVGIGTNAPATKLNLKESNSGTEGFIITNWNSVNTILLGSDSITGGGKLTLKTNGGASNVFISSYGDSYFSGGNVGIGTTSPSTKLHVVGASIIANNSSINPDTYGNTVIAGAIGTVGGWGLSSAIGGNAGTGHSWAIGTNGDNLYMGYSNGSSSNSMLTFLQVDDSTRNVFLVPSAGNVGIGTASPSYKLDVSGALRATGTLYSDNGSLAGELNLGQVVSIGSSFGSYANLIFSMHNGGGFSDILKLQGNGNVGIGTASPSKLLHVNGEATFATNSGGLIIRSYDGDTANIRPSVGNGSILISDDSGLTTRGTEFLNNGGIIVNATSGAPLTVNANGTIGLYVNSTANVGIGNTSPSTLLDVSGVITATGGNSTNWNTAYGWGNHASASYVPQARTLTINGTSYDLSANRTWTISTATAAGSDTQVQYNSSGSLAGASALIYNSTTNRVGINQASPGYDLDVNGQVRVQDKLRIGTGNGVVHMSSTATINASATTIVWAQNVSVGMCAFIEYYILNNNSLTDQRAGTIIVTWNQSGTPTITHTETTTPDIGSTTAINFTSSLVGSGAQINAVNSSANPYTMVMSYKYF
jgi:hypothetical protein